MPREQGILGDLPPLARIDGFNGIYTPQMAKHLIDLDEEALGGARAELGTTTIRDTVNQALQAATSRRGKRVAAALDVLARADLGDRADAWR